MQVKTKFVIVGDPNCDGTNLFNALSNHDNCNYYGQLFNRSDYGIMSNLEDRGVLIKLGEDPIDFLESKILTDHDPDIAALGFCLMYEQARSDSWNKVWRYIRKSFKIIHLKERDLLGQFVRLLDSPRYVEPVELQKFLDRAISQRKDHDIIFKHSEILDLYVEDLEPDLSELGEFLNLPVFESPLELPIPSNPLEKITNYNDLHSHFEGKSYEEFFKS